MSYDSEDDEIDSINDLINVYYKRKENEVEKENYNDNFKSRRYSL